MKTFDKEKSITESRNEQFKLQDIHVINTILNNSHDTVYFKDINSRFLLISKAQALGFGLKDPRDAIGKSDFDFFPEELAREAFEDEQRIMKSGRPIIGKLENLIWPTGKIMWATVSKYPLYDLDGSIVGTWGSSRDITELTLAKEELERVNKQLQAANKELEILSATDSLSGLYNSRLFFEEAQKEYLLLKRQGRHKSVFSIILLDIDSFKNINDSHGHLSGDFAIKFVADQIKKTIRGSDKSFRYGGDEFIVLLPNTERQDAVNVAEKIRLAVSGTLFLENEMEIRITISSGTASSNEAGTSKKLLELADKRLYQSKQEGRNRVT